MPRKGLGKHHDFDRALVIFEREDAHPIALLGLEAAEAPRRCRRRGRPR